MATQRMIEVKAHPKAKRNRVEERAPGRYEIWTTAAPDRGAANEAITRLLADHLGIAPARLTLRRGATARAKFFEVA